MPTVKTIRNKGKQFERLTAKKLSPVFGIKLGRTQSSGALDIKGDIRPLMTEDGIMPQFEWVIECKNQKVASIPSWLKQMREEEKANNKKGMLVFHLHKTKRDMVVLNKDTADRELYPEYVAEPGKVERMTPVSNTFSHTDHIKVIAKTFELYGKHFIVDFGEYVMMNIETFILLYKENKCTKFTDL